MSKTRLDVAMAAQGLAESRQKAQAIIMSGLVFVDGKRVDKCGAQIADTAVIEVRGKTLRYVSRGGLKLEKAMQCFPLTLQDAVAMDCGASTGGFTDCMLQNGAKKVYAVDVGYGQLDWKLRQDERVVCMERTNARYLTREQIPEPLDFVSVDVSFISLTLILPPCMTWLKPGGLAAVLIKPQFELGPGETVKGVVRDEAARQRAVDKIVRFCTENLHLESRGVLPAAIKGPKGNQEYMALFARP